MTELQPRFRSPVRAELDDDRARVYDAITGGPRAGRARLTPVADAEGRLLGPFGPMLLSPGVGDAVQELGAAIRFLGALRDDEREIAILAVAAAQRSGFEWFAHDAAARAAWVPAEDVAAVRNGERPACERLAAVWDIARELMASGSLDDAAFAAAQRELGAPAIAELVWLTGYYAMLATALRVFDPPVPEDARLVFASRE